MWIGVGIRRNTPLGEAEVSRCVMRRGEAKAVCKRKGEIDVSGSSPSCCGGVLTASTGKGGLELVNQTPKPDLSRSLSHNCNQNPGVNSTCNPYPTPKEGLQLAQQGSCDRLPPPENASWLAGNGSPDANPCSMSPQYNLTHYPNSSANPSPDRNGEG